MVPIFIMWIVVIFMAIRLLVQFKQGNKPIGKLTRQNEIILFVGSFAFLFGVLGQVIGLFNAFGIIEEVEEISPALLAGGLRVSSLAPIYGLVLFLVSGIIWFVFRSLINAQKQKNSGN